MYTRSMQQHHLPLLMEPVPARTTAVRSMGATLQEDGRKQHKEERKEGMKEREEGGVSPCCYLTSPPFALLGML